MLLYCYLSRAVKKRATRAGRSALTLFVAQVLADHHDPAMTADHLALVADLLDAGLDLHACSSAAAMCVHTLVR